MKMAFNGYDVARAIVDSVDNDSWSDRALNEQRLNDLKEGCALIDELSRAFEVKAYTVEINEDSGLISISLELGGFCIESYDTTIYKIFTMTDSWEVSPVSKDVCVLTFTFPGVWEEK